MNYALGFHDWQEWAYSRGFKDLLEGRQKPVHAAKLETPPVRSSNTSAVPRQSLIEYLGDAAKRWSGNAFVQHSGYRIVRWSYRDVAGVASQFARELEARGIEPGDRVLLWGRNSAEWVAAFFGCILRGAVAVPMDQGATPGFAARVAQQVDAKLLIISRKNGSRENGSA